MPVLSITKDDKLFCDHLQAHADPVKAEQSRIALQAFVTEPKRIIKKQIQAFRKQIQSFGVSTDFTLMTTNAFNVIVEEDNFDLGWQQAFREVPKDADKDHWEIGTVTNGITFKKVAEGQRIEMDKLSGTKELVYVDYYGGAIGFTDRMIRYRLLAQMVDKAMAFRNKFWANKADNHYALISTAASGNVIAWQGAAADIRVQRDVLTINQGAFTIGNVNKDKGYGDMANAPLLMYANPFDEDRIEAAFRVTTNFLASGQQSGTSITRRPIVRIYTYNSQISAGSPLLVLPGRKAQMHEDMAPTTYVAPTDILTLNKAQAVWSIYGAGIGDTDQFYQLTLG